MSRAARRDNFRAVRTSKPLLVAIWALAVVLATFVEAIHRLGARAIATIAAGLSPVEWVVLVVVVAVFVWGEGHRALQRRFAPRVVARAYEAGEKARGPLAVLVAPLSCLSLVGADRRALARAWGGVALIVLAVLIVRAMPEPWRGIVDAGVSAALLWGAVALVVEAVRQRRTRGAG